MHRKEGVGSGDARCPPWIRRAAVSRPQGHLPRLMSDGFGPVLLTIQIPRDILVCTIPLCTRLVPQYRDPSIESPCQPPNPLASFSQNPTLGVLTAVSLWETHQVWASWREAAV